MDKHVTIYSTPTCHFCHMAKDFFTEKGVQFTDYNVASDAAKRTEMIQLTGQLGVPVIVINDDIMVGFDRNRLAAKLGIEA
jgi:glutaredoxin 3